MSLNTRIGMLERMYSKDNDKPDARRPQNVRYEVRTGDVWTYFDAEKEGAVEWLVVNVNEHSAMITKMTGDDVGYTTLYELERMQARRWRPKTGTSVQPDVLWACPDCGEDKPIKLGDYVCVECREALDKREEL